MIGEGTKIDNLVQIGHNVVIGRHCVIVAQVGIAGSTTLEDFVVLGGQVGLAGHLTVGMGAQVAAQSGVAGDIPRGARYGGSPAQPALTWAREIALLKIAGGQARQEAATRRLKRPCRDLAGCLVARKAGASCRACPAARLLDLLPVTTARATALMMRRARTARTGETRQMNEATTTLGVADIQKIMACIPHRYPFLLVDRVVEIERRRIRRRHQERHRQRAAVHRPFSRTGRSSRAC